MTHPKDPSWKIAGSGMTDADMSFLADVLKKGPKEPELRELVKQWDAMWDAWADAGRQQAALERHGVGSTEADSLFNGIVAPKIKRFQSDFDDLMGHLIKLARK